MVSPKDLVTMVSKSSEQKVQHMKLGYTEFSFGYAFTENLIRSASAATGGAPYFPNLILEGRFGYDVRIDFPGVPLYLQYKLPHLMVKDTAGEISRHSLRGIATPFFRMHLMKRSVSRQHQLLVDLEHQHPHSVYYATPELRTNDSFNSAYTSASVHLRSALFSPNDIGLLPDNDPHVVAYRDDLPYAWFCSHPREIRVFRFQDVADRLQTAFEERRYRTVREMARPSLEELMQLVPRRLLSAENAIRQRIRERRTTLADGVDLDEETMVVVEDLLVCREFARVGLSLEFVLAQPTG